MRKPLTMIVFVDVVLLSVTWAGAVTVTIPPAKDNTLYQDAAGSLSNGAGEYFFAGTTGNGLRRRGLLAFDIAGNIPAGSVVTSVTLTLNMSRTTSDAQLIELHRVLADWGEGASNAPDTEGNGMAAVPGDATWLHTYYNTSFWTNPGGDFATAVSGSQSVGGIGFYTWSSTPPMVADVQNWLEAPAGNFGWLLQGPEGVASSAKRFDSKDNPDLLVHPRLVVEYVPEPAALALMVLGGLAVITRKRG